MARKARPRPASSRLRGLFVLARPIAVVAQRESRTLPRTRCRRPIDLTPASHVFLGTTPNGLGASTLPAGAYKVRLTAHASIAQTLTVSVANAATPRIVLRDATGRLR